MQRPRKLGAKFTGEKIAPDEFIPESVNYDFEGKRDIWNGFDPREHQRKIFEEYSKIDEVNSVVFSFHYIIIYISKTTQHENQSKFIGIK